MGIEYLLAREDTRTMFELGKTACWQQVFYRRERDGLISFTRTDVDDLAAELAAAWTGEPCSFTYFLGVARRIVAWSDGRPITFTSDHDDDFDAFGNGYRIVESIYEAEAT